MSNPNLYKYGFGTRPKEVDDEYRSRTKGVPKKITWTKEKCIEELNDILDLLKKILKDDDKLETDNPRKLKRESVKDYVTMMNRVLEFMKYLYPPVQQNINLNIDMTADVVIERLKNWKRNKINEEQKSKEVIFDIVEVKQNEQTIV